MPRAVSPWMWRIALRDHWRGHTSVLLTLYTVGTYMDRTGMAYPGQKTLATAIRATVKTVQRHIETAERAGFLSSSLAGRTGKGWRHYVYQAVIPDNIELTEQEEYISDAITAEVGAPEGGDKLMSPAPRHEGSRSGQGGDIPPRQVATFGKDGGDISATSWRQADVALTPTSELSLSKLTLSEARLAPSERDKDRDQEQEQEAKRAEYLARLNAPKFPRVGEPRGLPGGVDTDRPRRIRAYAAKLPDQSAGQIAHVFACGIEEVRSALAGNP